MTENFENLKLNRKSLWMVLIHATDLAINDPINLNSIEELLNQLKINSNSLSEVDKKLQQLI